MKRDVRAQYALLLLRVLLGALLLIDGLHAVRELQPDARALVDAIELRLADAPGPFAVLGRWIIDAPERASALLRWGALVGGVLLFLGALVRPAGFVIALAETAAFSLGAIGDQPFHLCAAAIALACSASAAGRTMGFDRALDAWLPRWLTWASGDLARSGADPFA